jgi:1-deoxy-D-xylulose-5-phosphate reductoisomerase
MTAVQRLAILGSTGSIGTSTLDVVARHPDRFVVDALSAYQRTDVLIEQCRGFKPRLVVLPDEERAGTVRAAVARRPCARWRRRPRPTA